METTRKTIKRALSDALLRLDTAATALGRLQPGTPDYERALVDAERLHADVTELLKERRASDRDAV